MNLEVSVMKKDKYDAMIDVEELMQKYDIKDDEVILRILELKKVIKDKKQKDMSNDEIITFLESVMNYDEMNIWLIRNRINRIKVSLNDELKKFFELKSNEEILILYDVDQNFDQNNIDAIRRILNVKC